MANNRQARYEERRRKAGNKTVDILPGLKAGDSYGTRARH